MNRHKEPLYRKEKKTGLKTRYYVNAGGENRWSRNTKQAKKDEDPEIAFQPHRGKGAHKRHDRSHEGKGGDGFGYDYTPLYKFLLSKVGQNWDEVFEEAKDRLDKTEPIFYIVQFQNEHGEKPRDIVRIGENTEYSGLTVIDGKLVKVDPNAIPYKPSCTCCTHSFNGKAINKNTPVRDYETKLVKRYGEFTGE